mmetsp:Transcript_13988/g.32874  ORF Transcript_13988/g.32874 Transcript_13988/m.32874 type:complete len:588 (-) Transcript_13988:153-1916(-)
MSSPAHSRSRGILSQDPPSEVGSYKLIPQNEPNAEANHHEPSREDLANCMECTCSGSEFMEHPLVQGFTISMILANAIIIGFETDFPHLCQWDIVENAFLCVFTAELVLRLFFNGCFAFFRWHNNPDFLWNIFDFSVMAFGIANILAGFVEGEHNKMGKDATLFRIIRLLRILRVLRIIRIVRFLKQLYLLAYGFVEGTLAVFWVTLLAGFMLYICSVILVRTYGRAKIEDEAEQEFFVEKFGTIPRTMFSLFELITSPDLDPYRSIMFKNPPLVIFLVIFIILGSFGINGLLVALINESILEKNQARLEADRMDREYRRKQMQDHCKELFDSLDVNKNRVLPREKLMQVTTQLAEFFESMGFNFQRKDLDQMFYIMDYNDTGFVERSEFVQGVLELCDQIRPMSIMELHYQVSKCVTKVEQADAKVDGLAKVAEHHDMKLERAQRAVERLGLLVEPGDGQLTGSFDNTSIMTPGSGRHSQAVVPRSLRDLLLDYRQQLNDAHDRVEAVLGQQRTQSEGSQPQQQQPQSADLQGLGECLMGLQRSNLEVLGALLTQAWSPGRTASRDASTRRAAARSAAAQRVSMDD